jgi:hypothetical protein
MKLHLNLEAHHVATGNTRHTVGGEPMAAPTALEIVERDSAYYLLYLDDTGGEMTDTWHSSLDDAKRQASSSSRCTRTSGLHPTRTSAAAFIREAVTATRGPD